MEQEKLTQFRHTLSRRIQLGTAYACLVLVLLAPWRVHRTARLVPRLSHRPSLRH